MSTKPYSPVGKNETEAVAHDEKEAEDKEEDEKEEEKVEELPPQKQLFYYCRRSDIDGIKSIASQCDIDAVDNTGNKNNSYISQNTALHYAVLSGSLETVKVIYNLEAKLDSKNKLGSTPLHLASSLGYTEIVQFLIEMKADIEAKNKIQNTPLHCAVYAGHVDVVKIILEHCDDKRQSLMLPANGVGFGAVKYTAHDEMKAYLKQFFPKKKNNKIEEDNKEQEMINNQNGNDIVEEQEEQDNDGRYVSNVTEDVDDVDETTGLTSGTATATEQQ